MDLPGAWESDVEIETPLHSVRSLDLKFWYPLGIGMKSSRALGTRQPQPEGQLGGEEVTEADIVPAFSVGH